LSLKINGSFNFWRKILRKATMLGSTTYIFLQLILHLTTLRTNLHYFSMQQLIFKIW
jgi:hypothetical protein